MTDTKPESATEPAAHTRRPPVDPSVGPPTLPDIGTLGMARWAWRQLTSMRTALFLLLLIAVAAVPGSVFPQRNIDSGRVADYLNQNPTTGPWLDRLGFFDVYASPWFSAIYLLLFISLLGCIVPRSRVHLAALRSAPPRAPARLSRLPESVSFETDRPVDELLAEAQQVLRARRFRVHAHDDASVSAESGHWRETGNLVFHLALTGIIIGMAVGHLFGWRGELILPEGGRFASMVKTYNTFRPGPLTNAEDVPGFVLSLPSFTATFNDQAGRSFGTPKDFIAHTTVQAEPGAPVEKVDISVNHPLRLDGAYVYLLGNGYAPVITVRDAKGEILYREATPFLTQDANYKSVGVVKVSALPSGKQLGLNAMFLPTVEPTFAHGPMSLFPDARDPEIALSVWEGTLFPGDRPQSVYTLDTSELKQVMKDDGSPALARLKPGQTYTIPGGRGTISFDEVRRYAGLSVRHDPGELIALISAMLATGGLILGLLVRRRRVFVRAVPGAGGATVVTVGGLAKDSDSALARIVAEVATSLTPTDRHDQNEGRT